MNEWEQTYLDAYRSCNLCLRGRSLIKPSVTEEIPRRVALHTRRICRKKVSVRKHLLSWPLCRGTDWCAVPARGPWITHAASKPRLRRARLTAQSSLSSSAALGRPRGRPPPRHASCSLLGQTTARLPRDRICQLGPEFRESPGNRIPLK